MDADTGADATSSAGLLHTASIGADGSDAAAAMERQRSAAAARVSDKRDEPTL